MSEDNLSPYASLYAQQPAAPQPVYYAAPTLGSLDLPYPGAGPILAVKRMYQNYAKFSGRASRSEYWWGNIVVGVASCVLIFVGIVLGYVLGGGGFDEYGVEQPGPAVIPFFILVLLLNLASIVPTIALTVRRLHDGGFSGLWYLVNFVPYVGSFVIFVLAVLPSKPEGMRYDRVTSVPQGYAPPAQSSPYAPLPPQTYGQRPPTPGV